MRRELFAQRGIWIGSKYKPHLLVVPEDDANRQIAVGFVSHHAVRDACVRVVPPVGGWLKVLQSFHDEYECYLHKYPAGHVVLLIDFDDDVGQRHARFEQAIPAAIRPRVFVVGAQQEPESLRQAINLALENIGAALAEECLADRISVWNHAQLQHNDAERQRMIQVVKPFLFA